MNDLLKAALELSRVGISVIPDHLDTKYTTLKEWKPFQKRIATNEELQAWFAKPSEKTAVGIVCGDISGHFEMMDFDAKGECWPSFRELVEQEVPGLVTRLILEKSQNDGYHLSYRCTELPIPGSMKLAQKPVEVSGPGEHEYKGKKYTARQIHAKWCIIIDLIETRGEGGQFLCAPSPGYELLQGSYAKTLVITAQERDLLINTAKAHNQHFELSEAIRGYTPGNKKEGRLLPGQDFDTRGDVRAILGKHGWVNSGRSGKTSLGYSAERWRRPGKERNHSASLISMPDVELFKVFSANAFPFQMGALYSPFAVYALLEHGGDFTAAARELAKQDFGENRSEKSKGKSLGTVLLNLTELEQRFEENISWTWRQHIPKAMPVIINGREGIGKTGNCLQIAQDIVNENPNGIVLWIASEGFIEDTKDKMTKIGVDSSRIPILAKKTAYGEDYQFNFSLKEERDLLEAQLDSLKGKGIPVLAVFIDSIRGIHPYEDTDSRIKNVMMALNGIVCDRHRASLIYLHHLKKGKEKRLIDASVGSTCIASSVRAVYTVLYVSEFVRKIVQAKLNVLGHRPPTLMSAQDGNSIRIYESHEQAGPSLKGQAQQWLIDLFKKKPEYLASEIYDLGKSLGLTEAILKKAKTGLPIKSVQETVGSPWRWKCEEFVTPNTDLSIPLGKNEKIKNGKPNKINEGDERDERTGGYPKTFPEIPEGREGRGRREGSEKENHPSDKNINKKEWLPPFLEEKLESIRGVEDIPPEGIEF